MDKKKRILVTGGAGFIGSHLCRRLLESGHEVICLDNFSTSTQANIAPLLDHSRFFLVTHDITLPFHFEVDEIYHLASPASPRHYQSAPIQTIKTCVLGTIHVLELAHQQDAKVLHASTSEVYGDPLVHPQREDYWGHVNPVGLRSCYDEGKRCAETVCLEYHRQYGLDLKIVRIFNTYGPHMQCNDGRVVSNLIVQALKGENMTVFGDGRQTRSFCYVDDLIAGLLAMMDTERGFTGPVNLGNEKEVPILELAEKILQMTGSRSLLTFQPLPQDDPRRRQPDVSLAKAKLGWEAKVPLEEGLQRTITYFRKVLQ